MPETKGKANIRKESLIEVLSYSDAVYLKAFSNFHELGITQDVIRKLMREILNISGRWFYTSKTLSVGSHIRKITSETCKDWAAMALRCAAKLLQGLGFGKVVMSVPVPGRGPFVLYFVKREATAAHPTDEFLDAL